MKKKNQLLGCFLLGSTLCMGQVKYWTSNMKLYPLDGRKTNRILVDLGAGISTPIKNATTKINMKSNAEFRASVYIPLGWQNDAISKRVSVGLYAGFSYGFGYGNGGIQNLQGINIIGQQAASVLAVRDIAGLQHRFLSTGVGIRAQIQVNKFIISPMLGGDLLQLNQQKMEVMQSSVISNPAGLDKLIRFTMFTQHSEKTRGLSFLPGLRMGIVMGLIDFWAEGQYTNGPVVKWDEAIFVPQGLVKPTTGYYTLTQIQQGKLHYTEGRAVKYQSLGIRFGTNLKFPKYNGKPRKKCNCL